MAENYSSQIQERKEFDIAQKHVALVIDDYFLIRHNFKLLLEKMGLKVDEAKNGQEALDMLAAYGSEKFSLIIVDLSMPVMNGTEFLERAKSIFNEKLPPVLVCSSNTDVPLIKEVISLGINGYILKPIDFKALMDKVHELIPSLNR